MFSLRTHVTDLFEQHPDIGIALLLAIALLIALLVRRKLYRKHIDSNGKVIVTPRFKIKAPASIIFSQHTRRKKAFTPLQRRALRILYAAQEAFFGIIVFGFGLVMLMAVLDDISHGAQSLLSVLPAARLLVSILTIVTGILLIYFRNIDNPFDDS